MERCSFILEKKHRKCRMLVKSGHKYCGEHSIHDEHNKERVLCPNDPKHTVKKSELQKHLMSRCNSRLHDNPWIIRNFNVAGSSNEMEPWYRPTANELLKMQCIIERVYEKIASGIKDSFLKNDTVEIYAADSTKVNRKHLQQISSIIEHLATTGLLNNDERWCLVDFGAGKAQLSYYLAKIAPKCRFLLIDRMGSRNKYDSKAHKEINSLSIERLRCSVEHLNLSKTEMLQYVDNIAAVCKHLCGAATDFAIQCLMNGVKNGLNVCGFVLAPCCHHKTAYNEYVGRTFLESCSIASSADFAALRHISTWAVCGFPNQKHADDASSHLTELRDTFDQEFKSGLLSNPIEKELIGQKAKAILEYGRVFELQSFGFDVALYRYIQKSVSPENLLIVGKKC